MRVNYLEYRNKMISDRNPCVICGELAQTVHHKDENQDNNDTENYLDVCRKCDLLIKHKKNSKEYKSVPKFKKAPITKTCLHCRSRFTQGRKDKIYCSPSCKYKAWAKTHPRIAMKP